MKSFLSLVKILRELIIINQERIIKWDREVSAQSSPQDLRISPVIFRPIKLLKIKLDKINRKLVSGEVRTLLFSVVQRELISRH